MSHLYRLFSVPVYKTELDLNFKQVKNILNNIDKLKFRNTRHNSKISVDLNILDKAKFKNLKEKILNAFVEYKDGIMKLANTKIKMTNSWCTKTDIGSSSDYHNHSNSMFSGVLYFNTDKDSGPITFNNFSKNESIFDNPTEKTTDNSSIITLATHDNMILFFPSYVYHKIDTHKSKKERYSIAFNFMPYGTIGEGDSKIQL